MLASRFAIAVPRILAQKPVKVPTTTIVRLMAFDSRQAASRQSHAARRKTLKEASAQPTSGLPFSIGQGAVAGASALGLGALAFYGLGFGNQAGAIDKSIAWPAYVKQRIRDTYMYFGASIGITAATAASIFRSPALTNIVMRQGWIALGASIAAMIGSGILVRSIPYEEGFGAKQLAWIGHMAVMGAVVAPVCMLGGAIVTRAAWYTAGVVGGLTTIAVTAPSEKFLYMGGPLAMGFGVVFMSSIASAFLPPTTALGAGLYSIALYGGLVLFSGFLLYDTQKIIHKAERTPVNGYGVAKFDPINNCISIYADTLNIFIRIAQILAMGGNRRK